MATKWYAEQALEAGCGFINCIPVFIASGWVQDDDGTGSRPPTGATASAAPGCR